MSHLRSASSTVEIQAPAHQVAERFESLILHGTVLELYEANLNFHQAFLHPSGNDELDGIIAELRQRTSSAPVSQWKTRARIEQSAREHHEMVDLLQARDGKRLKALIERHIRQR